MRLNATILGTTFALLLFLSFLPTPLNTSMSGTSHEFLTASTFSKSTTYIEEIPYVWQEINGFCHWSSLSMMLQHIGLPMKLNDVFAATGIGFSAVYVQFEDIMTLIPGSNYRQLYQAQYLEAFQGIDYIVIFDNSTEDGQNFTINMDFWNLDYHTIEGAIEAQETLCHSIDDGYPLLLWVDPYYLPVHDYDILRDLNLHSADTGSGHAVLAIGYNDTTQEVWLMDPGVGALGDDVAYPSDGRWHYSISYSDLTLARENLAFGAIQIKPGAQGPTPNSNEYSRFIYERILGIPTSYELVNVNPSLVFCGARAFSQLSIDLASSNLAYFLVNLGQNDLIVNRLYEFSIILEQMITLQHLSFRSALASLPAFLPEYDLSVMQSYGQAALPHFEALSTNDSLTTFDPTSYSSLIKDTFWGIADLFEHNGNIFESVTQYSENLVLIQTHLNGIAIAWKNAGQALQDLVNGPLSQLIVTVIFTSGVFVLIVVPGVIAIRNRRKRQR
ncbi:MAG: C39 family peptidase [Candidatus Hermodarchaeota archaeon]|nr:C39 family peptidase [Candidatus Hermodarchaeota archaeon]